MATVKQFLAIEVATFGGAALLHAGVLLRGYQHPKARNAEAVIALVLLGALVLSQVPRATRGVALGAQGFALAGTGLGIVMIAIGVGPRSLLDFSIHATMVTLLVLGLRAAARSPVARS